MATTRAAAQTLEFTAPVANAVTALGATTNYTLGEDVRIAWQTGFEVTTLRVLQGPLGDGSFVGRVLAANNTRDETSFMWRVARIDNVPLSRSFHFELTNGEDASCTGCNADSLTFYVSRAITSTSSSRSPTTSTSSTSSTVSSTNTTSSPTTTTSSSPTNNIAGAAASTPTPSTSHRHRHALAQGLGFGLGLGIPLLLALLALCAFCLLRRRRNQRRSANVPRDHQPNLSVSNPLMQEKALPGSPGHPQIAYFGAYTPNGRDRSSGGTASTAASSYHGPFEFERPGSEHFDARSIEREMQGLPRFGPGVLGLASSAGSGGGSLRTATPRSEYTAGGGPRLASIDEDGPPRTPPEWPLRS